MKQSLMINTKLKAIFAAMLIIGLAQGCGDKVETANIEPISIKASVITADYNSKSGTKEFAGVLKSVNRSELGTKVMGTIKKMPVTIGQKVKKGDLLLHISDNDLVAQKNQIQSGLNSAKANLELAEKNLNRFRTLYEQKSATQKEWDEVQLNHSMAKNKVVEVENKLKEIDDLLTYTQIKAPFAGVIAAKNAEVGDLVTPGRPLIVIESTEDFEIEFKVGEADINNVQIGDSIQIALSSISNQLYSARVSDVSSAGEELSNQYLVKVRPQIPSEKKTLLRTGMYATAYLPMHSTINVSIPVSALVQRGQLEGIYVLNAQNVAILRWIRIGDKANSTVEVLSGLKAGEKVIKESALIQHDAQKIIPIN